jgi:hypothetical protein
MAPVEIPVPSLYGEFDAHVHDPSGHPTNVIPTEDTWSVHATWYLQGPVAPLLDGTWQLQVAYESIGDGPEGVSPTITRDYQSDGSLSGTYPDEMMSFDAFVYFPAGTPGLAPGQSSTTYKVTAYLTFLTPAGTPGPFAAVYDLGIIQIFDSPKP